MSVISAAPQQKLSQVSRVHVCVRMHVERGPEQILGMANRGAERQSVIKKTVCGYLGKCLGMCGGGVGWGQGTVH